MKLLYAILISLTIGIIAGRSSTNIIDNEAEQARWDARKWEQKAHGVLTFIIASEVEDISIDVALTRYADALEDLGTDPEHCDNVSLRRENECLDHRSFSTQLSRTAKSVRHERLSGTDGTGLATDRNTEFISNASNEKI